MSSGIGGGQTWNLGQIWTKNITVYGLTTPDNLTITIVSSTQLVFRIVLPGNNPNIPPDYINVGYTPALPSVGTSVTVYAQIADDDLNFHSPYINVSQIPGVTGTGTFPMTFSAATGLWTYTIAGSLISRAGTFYVFLNATDNILQKNSVALAITVTSPPAPIAISLSASPSVIVKGTAVALVALVTNEGSAGGTATVTFSAGGTLIATTSGPINSGSTASFSTSWTPSTTGVVGLFAQASIGSASANGLLNETVFPKIVFVAHNVPGGTRGPDNTSAWLATELTAAGIPYTAAFVSCKSNIPAATFTGYTVAIVDFGSTWSGGCPKSATTTDEATITGATTTNFWIVGSNAFGTAACSSYNSAFFGLVGASYSGGGTCMVLPNATGAATYTATLASGVRADGVPASITINKTLAGVSTNVPYDYFNLGTTNTAYLAVNSHPVGTWKSGSVRGAALASEPALLAAQLPNANNWGTGVAGTAVVYNIVDWLSGLSNATATGRALNDFGVPQATLLGQSHSFVSTIYAGLRDNGPVGAVVTATLFVNGSLALFGGAPVAVSATVGAGGGFVFITLNWQAPSSGPFTLVVTITVSGPTDQDPLDSQGGFGVLNQAITFS